MFLILASSVAALAVAPSTIPGTVIAHGTQAYMASYQAQPTINRRDVEPRFANRGAIPVWQADISVNRAVTAQATSPVAPYQVARYATDRSVEAVAVARQDRAVLVNERDGVQALAKGAVKGV